MVYFKVKKHIDRVLKFNNLRTKNILARNFSWHFVLWTEAKYRFWKNRTTGVYNILFLTPQKNSNVHILYTFSRKGTKVEPSRWWKNDAKFLLIRNHLRDWNYLRAYKANNFSKISMNLIQRDLEKSVSLNFIILACLSDKILLVLFLVWRSFYQTEAINYESLIC